jgi:hypothetical protein
VAKTKLRRDTNQLRQNDTFGVILDTFYDRRNGYLFYNEPARRRADQAVTDEGNLNPIGPGDGMCAPAASTRLDRGDGIPFKSLRIQSGTNQVWGINIRVSFAARTSGRTQPYRPRRRVPGGMFLVFARRHTRWPRPSRASKNELKPYGIARRRRIDRCAPIHTDCHRRRRSDAKYGVTANLRRTSR